MVDGYYLWWYEIRICQTTREYPPYTHTGYYTNISNKIGTEKEKEKETVEHTSNVKTESSSSSDSEDEGTKEVKEEQDERLFKERTVDSMRNETVKEEPVQPGAFSGFSFKKMKMIININLLCL